MSWKTMTKSKRSTPMRNSIVLGVDPGFDRVGVAVLDKEDILFSDCIETSRKLSHSERLQEIGLALKEIIEKWGPKCLAIEKLFFNQNTTNALKVSEARGVVLYEAECAGLQVAEYSPQDVKIAVTGYGRADKVQIGSMVRKLVKFPAPGGKNKSKKMLDDELDAIALCITHLATQKAI